MKPSSLSRYHTFPSPQKLPRDLPVAQTLKNLPAMQETQVGFLDWEDPLEKGVANTPVLLRGESHGQRSLVGHRPRGHKESDTAE